MAIIKKKRMTFKVGFDYPEDMDDMDILDMFAAQIAGEASNITSEDIKIVEVDEDINDGVERSDISMEKLFDKWIIYLQKLDTFHKGFCAFTHESGSLTIRELMNIIIGGKDALLEKVDELRENNEDIEYQMFKSTFRAFLNDESIAEDIIEDEERFREEFDGYIHWNIEKLFDFPVLLIASKKYEIEYYGMNNEINESVPEQKEFKDKALKFITEEQLKEILINSWDGSGFFGIIINGSDIIKAIDDNKNVVSSREIVIGIYDGFNGSGYFKRVSIGKTDKDCDSREYKIVLNKSELDLGDYSLGAIFGNVEWIWN